MSDVVVSEVGTEQSIATAFSFRGTEPIYELHFFMNIHDSPLCVRTSSATTLFVLGEPKSYCFHHKLC
jgi:hypothetical protein